MDRSHDDISTQAAQSKDIIFVYLLPLSCKQMADVGRNLMAYFLQKRKIGLLLIWMFYLCNLDKTNDKVPPDDPVYGQLTTIIIHFRGFVYILGFFFYQKNTTNKLYGPEDSVQQFLYLAWP